jgi:phage terminase Nu1 subunit (DNA packaging protein)
MATKGGGPHATRGGIADTFAVSLPTVDAWVRQGCPVVKRGSRGVEWVFDVPVVIAWRQDKAVADATGDASSDDAEMERRIKSAKMKRAELELAKDMKEVAPVREFERVQAAMFANIRANIMNVPARALLQLLGETNETVFKNKLRAELTLALDQAASAELDLPEEEDEETNAG